MSFYVSTATFFLLHCDEWDSVVALPRHKFVTGATLLQLIQQYCGNQDHLTKVISSCLPFTNTYRFNSLFSLNYRWIATYYLFYTCLEITVTTYNSTTVIWPFWIWFTNTKIICSIIILNRECHNFETGIGVQCDWWETNQVKMAVVYNMEIMWCSYCLNFSFLCSVL